MYLLFQTKKMVLFLDRFRFNNSFKVFGCLLKIIFCNVGIASAQSGVLDSSFNSNGLVCPNLGSTREASIKVRIQSDGKIVAVGSSGTNNGSDFAIIRLKENGALDSSFNGDGIVKTDISGGVDQARTLAIQDDGKILVSGRSWNGSNWVYVTLRYKNNGTLDSSFGQYGILTTELNTAGYNVELLIQKDGKIVLAGITGSYNGNGNPNNMDFVVFRYQPDGKIDSTFNGVGKRITDISGDNDIFYSLALQDDGKIILVGTSKNNSKNDISMVRLLANGKIDSTFDNDGILTKSIAGNNDEARAVGVQPDGKIVIAGISWNGTSNDFVTLRFNNDGKIDSTFDYDGIQKTNIGTDHEANALLIQKDAKILVAGVAWNGANDDVAIVRYDKYGQPDSSFNGNGIVKTNLGYAEGANSLTIQPDDKIVISGAKLNSSNNSHFLLARYNNCVNSNSTTNISSCNPIVWNGNTYSRSGTYNITLNNKKGCDSLLTLIFTLKNPSSSSHTASSCNKYKFNNKIYYSSGVFFDTIPNFLGCDSVLTLNLTIYPGTFGYDTVVNCNSYFWNGRTFFSSGDYIDTIPNFNGCDSIINLHLTIKSKTYSYDTVISCNSYLWHGKSYYLSGDYFDTLINSQGCDSMSYLNLSINKSSFSNETIKSCKSYYWNNRILYKSGLYQDTLTNSIGCDSIIKLDLTIQTLDTSVSVNGMVLTSNSTNSKYQWLKCDDGFTKIIGATGKSYTAGVIGKYAVIVSQDSCIDTSYCHTVGNLGIFQREIASTSIFPNPTDGTININMGENYTGLKIFVFDGLGKIVFCQRIADSRNYSTQLEVPNGIYMVLITDERKEYLRSKIVKY